MWASTLFESIISNTWTPWLITVPVSINLSCITPLKGDMRFVCSSLTLKYSNSDLAIMKSDWALSSSWIDMCPWLFKSWNLSKICFDKSKLAFAWFNLARASLSSNFARISPFSTESPTST